LKKKVIKIIVVVAIIGLTVYGLLKNLDISLLWDIIININWEYCLWSLPIAILSHWVRAIRWKIYLEPIKKDISSLNLFSAVMVGYAINNITPRGGEVVRPLILARREHVSRSAVFATIIVERFIDVIFLLLMFGVVFFASRDIISMAFPWLNNTMLTFLIICVFIVVIFLFLMLTTNIFEKIIDKVAKPLLPKYYDQLCSMWTSFKTGFTTFKNPKHYLKNFVYSAMIWVLYAVPSYLMFFAFDFQSTLHLGLIDAGLLMVVSGIGMSIAPTPGGIGVYHWLVVTALIHLYPAISNEEALAFATVSHGVNLLLQVILGAAFMIRENIRKIPNNKELEINEDLTII
jgi:uncharacterized protein (TIRG00374 family)